MAAKAEAESGQDTKYIFVTGGVISGIGKGVVASSIGTILKACGVRVTSIKIDPYLNIGACARACVMPHDLYEYTFARLCVPCSGF